MGDMVAEWELLDPSQESCILVQDNFALMGYFSTQESVLHQ